MIVKSIRSSLRLESKKKCLILTLSSRGLHIKVHVKIMDFVVVTLSHLFSLSFYDNDLSKENSKKLYNKT